MSLTVNLHMKRGKWTAKLKKTDWAHTPNSRADNINVIGKWNDMNALLPTSIVLSLKMIFTILTEWQDESYRRFKWLLYTAIMSCLLGPINLLYVMRKLNDTKFEQKLLPFQMLEEDKENTSTVWLVFRTTSHKQCAITATNWQKLKKPAMWRCCTCANTPRLEWKWNYTRSRVSNWWCIVRQETIVENPVASKWTKVAL